MVATKRQEFEIEKFHSDALLPLTQLVTTNR